MDSIFGIGTLELIVILIVAGLVMGPKQIRKTAQTLGYWSVRLQRVYRQFLSQVNSELDAVDDGEIRETVKEVRSLGNQMKEMRKDILSLPKELTQEANSAVDGVNNVIGQAVEEAKTEKPPEPLPTIERSKTTPPQPPPPPKPIEVEGDPAA